MSNCNHLGTGKTEGDLRAEQEANIAAFKDATVYMMKVPVEVWLAVQIIQQAGAVEGHPIPQWLRESRLSFAAEDGAPIMSITGAKLKEMFRKSKDRLPDFHKSLIETIAEDAGIEL